MRWAAPGRIPTAWELRSYFQFPDRPTALTAWQQILAVDKLLEYAEINLRTLCDLLRYRLLKGFGVVHSVDEFTALCHPSEATMAKVLHLSRNTVAKHVRLLEEYGLIITERTQVQMKNGIRKNGNLRYTIVPMYDVLEQRYQRQMAELERQQVQQKLAAQIAEAPCSPL